MLFQKGTVTIYFLCFKPQLTGTCLGHMVVPRTAIVHDFFCLAMQKSKYLEYFKTWLFCNSKLSSVNVLLISNGSFLKKNFSGHFKSRSMYKLHFF